MRNFLIKLLVVLPLAFGAVSCNEEEEYIDLTSPYVLFKGDWTGSFSGTDSGTIEFSVDDNGKVVGTLKSGKLPNSNFELEGKVDLNGSVVIDYIYAGTKIGEFNGKMTDFASSGSWRSSTTAGNNSGTWSASKM